MPDAMAPIFFSKKSKGLVRDSYHVCQPKSTDAPFSAGIWTAFAAAQPESFRCRVDSFHQNS